MTTPAAITALQDIKKFLLAGNAIFTLVSKKSGDRKTFVVEVAEAKPGEAQYANPAFFVRLLVGPENSSDYRYLGFLFSTASGDLVLKLNKSGWGGEAGASFSWLLKKLNFNEANFFEQAEFWHAGNCGRCGHLLTDPESIARGLGPICANK